MLTSWGRHGAVGVLVLAALCGPVRAQDTPVSPTSVVVGSDGTIYGTSGALNGDNLVFKLTSNGPAPIHTFVTGSFTIDVPSQLIQGPDGQLYTTVHHGGPTPDSASEWVDRLTLTGDATYISGTAAVYFYGGEYLGPYVPATDGNFYFVFNSGPSYVYRRTPDGTLTALHTGQYFGPPTTSLVQALDGALYGLDRSSYSAPVELYRIALDGTFTVVHTFASEPAPGYLIAGADGNLYGVGSGIFRITTTGEVTTLHTFDVSDPALYDLVQAADGSFFGYNYNYNNAGDRIVHVASDGTVSTVHTFTEHEHVSLAAGPTGVYGAFPKSDSRPYGAIFVVTADGTYQIVQEFGPPKLGPDVPLAGDIDGDGKADLVAWRPSTGTWFWLTSSSGYDIKRSGARQWGDASLGDVPLLADMDGDGKADLVVWRASTGTWWWLTSSTGFSSGGSRQWGDQSLGDKPLLADMDGDGKADLIVWRASTGTWWWLTSSTGFSSGGSRQWGNAALGDVPLVGDLDGDGRGELIVWRGSTGTWFWLLSSNGYSYATAQQKQWGNAAFGDVPLVADLDGDHLLDLTVWRGSTGTWYWLPSTQAFAYPAAKSLQWGDVTLGDVPLPRDFDGDGLADPTVWRASTGTWYILTSSTAYTWAAARIVSWGQPIPSDVPMSR